MTLKDIAEEAGVSVMTVSNVLNGKSSRTSATTKERVLEIAKRNGYVINHQAKSLASKVSKIIAVVLYSIADEDPFRSPYNAIALGAITRMAQEKGYYLMIRIVSNLDEIPRLFQSWNVDGALMMGIYSRDLPKVQTAIATPMVFTDTYSDKFRQFTNIGIDDYKGGYLAGEYLISKGHKNIAFVGMDTSFNASSCQRFIGLCDSMAAHGLTFSKEDQYLSDVDYKQAAAVGKKLAERTDITAVFAASDVIAIGLMSGLHACGKEIPEDISIIGFDGLDIGQYSYPPLTTISQDIVEKTNIAMNQLIQIIESPNTPFQNVILDVSLVERQSVKEMQPK